MIRLIASVCLLAWTCVAVAGQEVDLYRVEVLVTSQAEAERNQATRRAFAELLIRVSGDTQAPGYPALAAAQRRATDYLHEFRYASTDQQLEQDGHLVPASLLALRFSAQAVERLLREAGLPFWPSNRPRLLIWSISLDSMGSHHRLPEDDALAQLRQRALLRGQPLLLPGQDFEDRIALSNESLWQLDVVDIRQASIRYQADAILAGRYQQDETGQWQANWVLLDGANEQTFDDTAAQPGELLSRALDAVSDALARRYAIVPGGGAEGQVVMRVEGVQDFAGYKQVQLYLEGLAMVSHLELLQADRKGQLLRLTLKGDQALLRTTLELGRRLVPVESSGSSTVVGGFDNVLEQGLPLPHESRGQGMGTFSSPLVYTWQP